MRGQTISFEKKNQIVKEFVEKINPYEQQPGLKFDLRGYSRYLAEHNIPGNKVPSDVMNMFIKKP